MDAKENGRLLLVLLWALASVASAEIIYIATSTALARLISSHQQVKAKNTKKILLKHAARCLWPSRLPGQISKPSSKQAYNIALKKQTSAVVAGPINELGVGRKGELAVATDCVWYRRSSNGRDGQNTLVWRGRVRDVRIRGK